MASLRNTAINLHRIDGADNIAEACPRHRLQRRPRPRPPQPPNPLVTSVLVNNAGALIAVCLIVMSAWR